MCRCGSAARRPSSSCWGGWFWWVPADVPAYAQAPPSGSFHGAGSCCRCGSPCLPCVLCPSKLARLGGTSEGMAPVSQRLPTLPLSCHDLLLLFNTCPAPGWPTQTEPRQSLQRAPALYGPREGLPHTRHHHGSQLGCFDVMWVGTTAEFRPKSSSSFCKLPFVKTLAIL